MGFSPTFSFRLAAGCCWVCRWQSCYRWSRCWCCRWRGHCSSFQWRRCHRDPLSKLCSPIIDTCHLISSNRLHCQCVVGCCILIISSPLSDWSVLQRCCHCLCHRISSDARRADSSCRAACAWLGCAAVRGRCSTLRGRAHAAALGWLLPMLLWSCLICLLDRSAPVALPAYCALPPACCSMPSTCWQGHGRCSPCGRPRWRWCWRAGQPPHASAQ